MNRRFVLIAVLLLVLGLTAGCTSKDRGQVLSGQAPGFELWSTSGSLVRLSDFSGNVILLDFWATWCPPCQEMVPVLSRIHRQFADAGVTVIGVSLDQDGLVALEPFITEHKVPYPVVLGTDRVNRAYGGIATIPTLFIVDREGRLVRKLVGYHSYGQLKDEINKYL